MVVSKEEERVIFGVRKLGDKDGLDARNVASKKMKVLGEHLVVDFQVNSHRILFFGPMTFLLSLVAKDQEANDLHDALHLLASWA